MCKRDRARTASKVDTDSRVRADISSRTVRTIISSVLQDILSLASRAVITRTVSRTDTDSLASRGATTRTASREVTDSSVSRAATARTVRREVTGSRVRRAVTVSRITVREATGSLVSRASVQITTEITRA